VREERKVVSVLFADLVGFTATAERLDPEDVRALQDPYWRYVRSEIERHGGTVEKFIGDAVVALFGAPVAHEDDPERAVRAALAIRDWAREQEAIQVRVGVTTGEALVRLGAQPLAGEGMVSGDVVNTAARLQTAAPADAILVDESTRRATRELVDYTDADAAVAKGKAEPIRVWEAVEARSRFGVDLFQHTRTPLVGRGRELDVLKDGLARVREQRSPQLVTLVGVPGIGKSRLVYELMRAIIDDPREIVTWRQGRSLPYGDGVSFWALAEIVKAQTGVLETETDAEAGEKLVRAVQALFDDDSEARWVERHLRRLVGLAGESTIPSERSEAFAAWRRFFEMLADRRPAVLVFEDLHWADEGLLDFVDSLVDSVTDVPLLVVTTARPELLDRRPAWGGGKANATTLSLSALSGPETLQLVRGLAVRRQLSATAEQALVEHAAGNALYAEQYVRVWEERGDAEQLPLPESVQGLIAARLDDLPPTEKSVLQNAAVFGKVFWQGAVVAVDGIDRTTAGECLGALERKQFVQRARRSTVADESEYAFRHVLVRDVVYSQIPRLRRAKRHERAAAWIESLGRIDDHAETLAYHYLSALELVGLAGEDTTQIVDRGRVALRQAADRAFALHAYTAAGRYYEKAIGLVPDDDAERAELLFRFGRALTTAGDERGEEALERAREGLIGAGESARAAEACALLAELWWYRGQRARANSQLEQARQMVAAEAASSSKAWVLATVSRYSVLAGESETGLRLGREALAMAETLGLDDVRAHTLNNIGIARCYRGDFGGIADLERSIEIASAIDSPSELARAYNNLATVFGELIGDIARDFELRREAVRVAESAGLQRIARYSRAVLIFGDYIDGNWDDFVTKAHQYVEESQRLGGAYQDAFFYATLAHIALARGEDAKAFAAAQRALELAREAGDPQILLSVIAHAAIINIELGNVDIARELARRLVDDSLERISTGGPLGNFPFEDGLALAADQLGIKAELGQLVDAAPAENRWLPLFARLLDGEYVAAADECRERGLKTTEAYIRLRGGERLLYTDDRDPEEGKTQLEAALAFYRSVGATRYIREAKALLAASQPEQEPAAP